MSSSSYSKDEIQTSIRSCLTSVDPRYYNSSFDLMTEIVNIFGDINFETVKNDIETLNETNAKLDQVIKILVEKHSDEFFKILGYIREMKKILESSKLKYDYAKVSIGTLTNSISRLGKDENVEWKLKSIYCSEIINKLTKTEKILEIIKDVDIYIQNNKIYEAIDLIVNSQNEVNEYEKEFQEFYMLDNINARFNKIEEEIINKLYSNIKLVIFFDDENIMNSKISSLLTYFLTNYSKISIDYEIIKPIMKFLTIINKTTSHNLKNFKIEIHKDNMSLSSYTLNYIIKCIKRYNNNKIMSKFMEKLNSNLSSLLFNSVKLLSEQLKQLEPLLLKYDISQDKHDKIKFLLLVQIPLIILTHSLIKTNMMSKHTQTNLTFINNCYEIAFILPLITFQGGINMKIDEVINIGKLTYYSYEKSEFYHAQNILQLKINEMQNLNINSLPILYKIYNQFYIEFKDHYEIYFSFVKDILNKYTLGLYKYYYDKFISKTQILFDIKTFPKEYDSDISNFKFLNELTLKIDQLKNLLIFAFDSAYIEITKIIKDLILTLNNSTNNFILKLRKECIHNSMYNSIQSTLFSKEGLYMINNNFKVLIEFQFRKYQTLNQNRNINVITTETQNNMLNKINNAIVNFIFYTTQTTKYSEHLILLTHNYKIVELLTKFISNSLIFANMTENFLYDIMRFNFNSSAKMVALLEQVGHSAFENISNEKTTDLSTLISISYNNLDKFSLELFKVVLLLKVEFCSLIISIARNINRNSYILQEPEITPEYYVNSFINEFSLYNNLFQYNLTKEEYDFIKKDYLLIVNNVFIECLKEMGKKNNVNGYGVGLLVKNFEFIKEKLGGGFSFEDEDFERSLFYFSNYANLVICSDERIGNELQRYMNIKGYHDEYVAPILQIRANIKMNEANTLCEDVGKKKPRYYN